MKKYNITYKVKETKFVINNKGESKIKTLGFIDKEKNIETKSKELATVFNEEELNETFGIEDIIKMKNKTHSKYILLFFCEELDNLFKFIWRIKKINFHRKSLIRYDTYIIKLDIVDGYSPNTNKKYKNNDFKLTIEGNGLNLSSQWSGVKPDLAKVLLIDKIRRHYDYNDIYKKYVEDELFLEPEENNEAH